MSESASTVVADPKTAPAVEPIRLMLGGRDQKLEGWTNIDLHDGPHVHIKTDVSDLSMFKDGDVSEIYASHVLEHFSHTRTLSVLKEWRRVLKEGSSLFVSVPDIDALLLIYRQLGNKLHPWILHMLYGDQEYPLAYHYTIFNYGLLQPLCLEAGFKKVRKISQMPYGLKDCSTLIDNVNMNPISVNIEAVA